MIEDLYAETVLLKALCVHTLAAVARTQADPAAFLASNADDVRGTIMKATLIDVPQADAVRQTALARADQLLGALTVT